MAPVFGADKFENLLVGVNLRNIRCIDERRHFSI
jgi:hypothetical protein